LKTLFIHGFKSKLFICSIVADPHQISWGRMHDTVVSTSPRLKSTYTWLTTTPACMTQTWH